jgi:hypothetical protein
MGVQLNIKDERTVALARKLADDLHKSVTETIREALEEKQRRRTEEIEAKVRDIMAIAKGARDRWGAEFDGLTSKEIMDRIYDENGLPI